MLCEVCKKNEATVHIKEFLNNQCKTRHLCPECAVNEGHGGDLNPGGLNMADLIFNINKLAESFVAEKMQQTSENKSPAAGEEDVVESSGAVCAQCGYSAKDIRKSGGLLGCPECYTAFADILQEAVDNVQHGPVHLGKRPQNTGSSREAREFELQTLQKELAALVAKEEYEAAAVCRDRISALKKSMEL